MGYYMSPVKIFEYMMAQKPIISTRYPEITGMFDPPKGGLAVPPGDASALMNAMKKLLVADRLKMGKYNRKKALAKYTWETSARIQLHEFAMILRDK
jgi:glycosyltransferase involved in cell wall biosynthesis